MAAPYVMRLCGDARGNPIPGFDGQFLLSFDFEAFDGEGNGDFTPRRECAMKFETAGHALEFIRCVPACKPIRDDGLPNRPLTSTNWSIEPLIEGADQ